MTFSPRIGDTVRLPARFGGLANVDGTFVQGHGVQFEQYGTIYLTVPEVAELQPVKQAPTLPITHVIMLIDASGSMGAFTQDVIGGYATFLDELAADKHCDYRITTTMFNTELTTICVDTRLAVAPRLGIGPGVGNYKPSGFTALLDAIGNTITTFEKTHPDVRDGDRVMLVINTDGAENASREHTWHTVNTMIDERVAGGQWASVYMGAGPAAWKQSDQFTGSTQTVNTVSTSAGIRDGYTGLGAATRSYAGGSTAKDAADILRTTVEKDAK